MNASSILTFAALAGIGVAGAAVYVVLVLRRPAAPPAGDAPSPSAGRPKAIRLAEVVGALARVGDDEMVFLDRGTGRLVTLRDGVRAVLESDDELEDDDEGLSRSQLGALRGKLRAGTLLALPTKVQTREFQLRERFCRDLPEGEAKEQMLKVLRGTTGFRSFDAAVTRLGIAGQWRRQRDRAFAEIASRWMREHGVAARETAQGTAQG